MDGAARLKAEVSDTGNAQRGREVYCIMNRKEQSVRRYPATAHRAQKDFQACSMDGAVLYFVDVKDPWNKQNQPVGGERVYRNTRQQSGLPTRRSTGAPCLCTATHVRVRRVASLLIYRG